MKPRQHRRIERGGFRAGTVQEFLGLTDEEMALIDLKVRLVLMLRSARAASGMTQGELAKRISSSQSRIAKMEAGSPDVSLDLLCKALFALGISQRAIGKAIATTKAA